MYKIYLVNRFTGRSTLLVSYLDLLMGMLDLPDYEQAFENEINVIDGVYEEI